MANGKQEYFKIKTPSGKHAAFFWAKVYIYYFSQYLQFYLANWQSNL